MVPDLILVLCVYWGLHHPTVGAVLGSFVLGYSVDVVSSPILGYQRVCDVAGISGRLSQFPVNLACIILWSAPSLFSLASLVKGLASSVGLGHFPQHRRLLDGRHPVYTNRSFGRRCAGSIGVCGVTARPNLSRKSPNTRLVLLMTILGDVARKDGAPELRRRTRVVYLVLILAFLGITSRLAVLQIAQGERYTFLSENNRVRIKRVPGTRGMIIDRQGELMVDSRPSFDLLFVPEDAANPQSTLRQLAKYLASK